MKKRETAKWIAPTNQLNSKICIDEKLEKLMTYEPCEICGKPMANQDDVDGVVHCPEHHVVIRGERLSKSRILSPTSEMKSETPKCDAGKFTLKQACEETLRGDREVVDIFLATTLEKTLTQSQSENTTLKGKVIDLTQVNENLRKMLSKSKINTNIRLFDLVRYMRSELYEVGLISLDEYTWLSSESPMATCKEGGSPSPRRLEDYDKVREKLTQSQKRCEELTKAIERFVLHYSDDDLIELGKNHHGQAAVEFSIGDLLNAIRVLNIHPTQGQS